jgi:hypothetical protein
MSDTKTNDLQFAPIETPVNPVDTPTDSDTNSDIHYLAIPPSTSGNPSGTVEPGSDLGSAFNLGNIAAATTIFPNNVSSFDSIDTYKFTIGDNRNLNLSLTGLSNNADIKLLDSTGREVAFSKNLASLDEVINLGDKPAGTYYAQVISVDGANTNYTLGLSTNDRNSDARASNLLPIEAELGNLNGNVNLSGTNLGKNDTSDVIHFSVLGTNKTLGVLLDGLSADADIRIIRDNNGNRVFDAADTLVGSGQESGNTSEQFNVALPSSGDYFAQVYQWSGETNYNLSLTLV